MAKVISLGQFWKLRVSSLCTCHFGCVFLLVLITLLQTETVTARNIQRRNSQRFQNDDTEDMAEEIFVDKGEGDLIGLIEERLGHSLKEYNDNFVLKRKIRGDLDEDIDDVEDSDEDDADEEEESDTKDVGAGKNSSLYTTIPVKRSTANAINPIFNGPTSTPTVHTTSEHVTKRSEQLLATTTPLSALNIVSSFHNNSNSSNKPTLPYLPGSGLPPGFKPPTGLPNKPPRNFHVKPPPGVHFPGKIPPLPPHLLKQLQSARPPPKKGELYLPEDYNNLVIPKLNLGKLIGIESYSAVPVLVFLNIRSVRDIDEREETLTLDLDLVIEWVDGFLFDPISAQTVRQADITLNPIFLKKIWRPDIYIDEIVKVKRTSLMNKPLKLKFNPANGFISYTTRLTVKLSCDMIYFYYPADTHRCEFTFRSYSYFSKDLQLSWLGSGVYLQDPYDSNFDLQVESIDNVKLSQTFRKLTNDTYNGLRFTILARRKLSFHLVQTYLPSIFFIVITWLCFLVPARMVEARIGISMTTLLTLTSMFASVRESTPIVSYVKAIDIWMVFCIFFVFLTLLEFATFVWLKARREDAEELKLERQRKKQGVRNSNMDSKPTIAKSPSLESIELRKFERVAEFTEKYAFIIFSVVFISFTIIYWSWLLAESNYFDWNVNSTLNADLH